VPNPDSDWVQTICQALQDYTVLERKYDRWQACSTLIKISIHFLYPLNPAWGRRGLEPIPSVFGQEAGYTLQWMYKSITGPHRDKLDKQPCMLTRSEGQFRVTNQPDMRVFGQWEEARGHRKNPHIHRGKHANSTQKGPSWDLNQEISWCEVTDGANNHTYTVVWPMVKI